MAKQGNIGVTSENIFPIIKKFLYSDHEIFLRELVSNAVDATQKLKTLASVGEFKGELGDLTIHVSFDKETKSLSRNIRTMPQPSSATSGWASTPRSWYLRRSKSLRAPTKKGQSR